MIQSIYIQNIKGFGNPGTTINLGLKTNKYNICFAPNGFGKSTIAAAINLLADSPGRLQPNKNIAYRNDETLPIAITITIDGVAYTANHMGNDIRSQLRCHVISSRVSVSTTQQNRGSYTHVQGLLDIDDVIVYRNIPAEVYEVYRVTDIRRSFGRNGKILSNMTVFHDGNFLRKLIVPVVKDALNHIRRTRTVRRKFDNIQNFVNTLNGTALSIREQMEAMDDLFSDFNALPDVQSLKNNLNDFCLDNNTNTGWFDFLWQLLVFWEENRSQISGIVKRLNYNAYKDRFSQEINRLNSTWTRLNVVEKNGNLVVEFPNATQISNGQRDFLTFISDITSVKIDVELHPDKKHLLVVDEVLDYLDDANMLALQHYLSQGLVTQNGNVYTCLLTHLSPQSFRSYVFSDKKVNRIFLDNSTPRATDAFLAFIAFREGLDRGNEDENALYDVLSSHFFHYHPDQNVDLRQELTARRRDSVRTSWGQVPVLKQAIIDEVNAYIQGEASYDPYAVCMGIRHKVEKEIFLQLPDDASKQQFIETHKTVEKFKMAEALGIQIPAHFNLITALHNDADHVSLNRETLLYKEKPIVYSLRHPIIRNMVAQIFNYDGLHPLPSDSIF